MKNKDIKISLIFTLIGLIAGVFLGLFQVLSATEEMKQTITEQLGTIYALVPISAIQTAVTTFITSLIGLKLAKAIHLKLNFNFEKNAFILAIIIGAVSALFITGLDKLVFVQYLQVDTRYQFSWIYFISSILYGGIIEEVLIRLFLMSLIILILYKLFGKKQTHIPNWMYITGIILAALFFAAGHLPATKQLLGFSTPIIIRAFLLNTPAGLGFGYLYWKKGLSYAIVGHMFTHIINQLIIMPLLF